MADRFDVVAVGVEDECAVVVGVLLRSQLSALDVAVIVPSLTVPVLFAVGRYDRHVDSRIAARYFDSLDAPIKHLVWFEESADNVPFAEPDRLNAVIREFLAQPAH